MKYARSLNIQHIPTYFLLLLLLYANLTDRFTPVRVHAADSPRIITLTSPLNGAVFTAPATITLTAITTDTNHVIAKVAFILNGTTKLGESSTPPYTFTWSNVLSGNYVLGAQALDSNGVKLANSNLAQVKIVGSGGGTSPTPTPAPLYTLTVNNGTGSGAYAAGTVVNISANAPPVGQVFLKWIGSNIASVTSLATTVTMPAANVSVTAVYGADQIVPQPVTSHPRLWVTANDLPRLRSWATASNPVYANGFQAALNYAVNYTNAHWNWTTGQPDANWHDDGTAIFAGDATEAYAEIFAFASLIDQKQANRDLYAQKARTLLMYVINQAALGPAAGVPFRDPQFAIYDRSRWWGEAFGLTVDWIYPYLSSQDKAIIRTVFLRWANEQLSAYNHPSPIGVTNSPQLLGGAGGPRWAANNYFSGHMRLLTLLALSFDAADDPAVNPSLSSVTLGNSLRSYLLNVTGAWLYEQYALYEDPNLVSAAYNVSPNGLGAARGGLSVEGSLYGDSIGFVQEALLALHTAGFHDVNLAGPQIHLLDSSYWDLMIDGFLNSIAPTAKVDPAQSYLGPIYQMASYGDMLRYWITPDAFAAYGALGVYDQLTGNAARLAKDRWIAANVIEGGTSQLYARAGGNIWGNSNASDAILYFLLFDPNAPVASLTDPRPNTAPTFYMPTIGRILARTDWTPNASWFDYKCGWLTINHQNGDCNQFEFYRKGEWLTKERSGYANDMVLMASDYHNTLALQNTATGGATQPNIQYFETETWKRGGQWTNGLNAGDPTVTASFGNSYVYATGDATNLYNRPDQWTPSNSIVDILHASRSIVWLKPDTLVVYDRATSKTANRFKRFNLVLTSSTTVNGKLATETTTNGQKFYIQNLLPANATLTVSAAENFNTVAQGEPSKFRLVIEDPSSPSDIRFLHVLQATDAGGVQATTQLVQSSAGAPFAGAITGNSIVLFPVSLNNAGGTTYSVPTTVTNHLVTGLTPGGKYDVAVHLNGGAAQVVITASGTMFTADSGGVLNFDLSTVQPSAVTEAMGMNVIYLPLVSAGQ
ncbi:MAG: Ig-like domain-containing protein [Caldilineaceae bacterium]